MGILFCYVHHTSNKRPHRCVSLVSHTLFNARKVFRLSTSRRRHRSSRLNPVRLRLEQNHGASGASGQVQLALGAVLVFLPLHQRRRSGAQSALEAGAAVAAAKGRERRFVGPQTHSELREQRRLLFPPDSCSSGNWGPAGDWRPRPQRTSASAACGRLCDYCSRLSTKYTFLYDDDLCYGNLVSERSCDRMTSPARSSTANKTLRIRRLLGGPKRRLLALSLHLFAGVWTSCSSSLCRPGSEPAPIKFGPLSSGQARKMFGTFVLKVLMANGPHIHPEPPAAPHRTGSSASGGGRHRSCLGVTSPRSTTARPDPLGSFCGASA